MLGNGRCVVVEFDNGDGGKLPNGRLADGMVGKVGRLGSVAGPVAVELADGEDDVFDPPNRFGSIPIRSGSKAPPTIYTSKRYLLEY